MILKGINGFIETVGGVLLYFIPVEWINQAIIFLTRNEWLQNPDRFFAKTIMHLDQGFTPHAILFGAFYLLSHGIVKLGLVVALVKKKLWAYPLSLAFLFVFIGYQFYLLNRKYTTGMMVLTVLDFLVVYLVWHEWKHLKRSTGGHHPGGNAGHGHAQ